MLPSLPLHSHSPSIVHCSASAAAAETTPAYQQPFSSLTLQRQPCNKSCRLFFFTLSHQPLSLSFLFPYHFRYLHHFSRCRRPCCTQSSDEGAPKRHQRSTRLHTLSNIDQLSNFFFFSYCNNNIGAKAKRNGKNQTKPKIKSFIFVVVLCLFFLLFVYFFFIVSDDQAAATVCLLQNQLAWAEDWHQQQHFT